VRGARAVFKLLRLLRSRQHGLQVVFHFLRSAEQGGN